MTLALTDVVEILGLPALPLPVQTTDVVALQRSPSGPPALYASVGALLSAVTLPVSFEFMGGTPPMASETLGAVVFTSPATFPGNFAGSVGAIINPNGVLPTATYVAAIYHNGVSIGTMTISTAGVFTFATGGGSPVNCATNDQLAFIGNATPDATLANFIWTLAP